MTEHTISAVVGICDESARLATEAIDMACAEAGRRRVGMVAYVGPWSDAELYPGVDFVRFQAKAS